MPITDHPSRPVRRNKNMHLIVPAIAVAGCLAVILVVAVAWLATSPRSESNSGVKIGSPVKDDPHATDRALVLSLLKETIAEKYEVTHWAWSTEGNNLISVKVKVEWPAGAKFVRYQLTPKGLYGPGSKPRLVLLTDEFSDPDWDE